MCRVLALALVAASPALAQSPDAGARSSAAGAVEVVSETDVMVPMRDGVRLATDIHRPAIDGVPIAGTHPILFQRTPYNKSGIGSSAQMRAFVEAGYVVVAQDMRGRYNSEGTFIKYHDTDATDGYDAVEWLVQQPFSNGQVGMWGTSYGAHNQAGAAKLNAPGLSALLLNMGGINNAWDQMVRWKGAFEQYQIVWAFNQLPGETDDPVMDAMLEKEQAYDWLFATPLRKGTSPLAVAPNFEEYYLELATRADKDDWTGPGLNWERYYEQTADIPMLHVAGWYDLFTGSSIKNYEALSRMKQGPQRLVVGPWDHGGNADTSTGDVDFGPESAIEDFATGFHLRWFDHFIKGEENGVATDAPVRLFVMGTGDGRMNADGRLFHGGYWRDGEGWPLPGTQFTNYYFHADGSLRTEAPSEVTSSTTFTFDPTHPVPSIGNAYEFSVGGFDQREEPRHIGSRPPYLPLRARPDVVVFQTEPLEEDVEVVGPIVVRLYGSSSAPDTDFTAKLVDVYPPSADYPSGFDLNLTTGIIRARYRNSPDQQELMQPGTVYEFEIEPFPTANVFKRGHRIRIDISSSDWPRFDVNPNTGEPLGQHRRVVSADNTIHHSPEFSSHVVLPIVPRGP
ncbi:MAG: CocE/NonD family hydrolase [Gemmatimonadota bacterium]